MSEYKVKLNWKADSDDFSYKKYTRTHQWVFGGGTKVDASAAPEYLGKEEFVNPEEAFAASLASCHLLTFLAIASFKNYHVKAYTDDTTAVVEKNADNKLAVTKVILRPRIEFSNGHAPDKEELSRMHNKAHAECFISNSVLTEVVVEPENSPDAGDGEHTIAGGRSQNIESIEDIKEDENPKR
jgi:organic hydroperoxide reductase OsmC/OhrA